MTLTVSAVVGASILVSPPKADPRIHEIEEGLGTHVWGWLLIVFGVIGALAEAWMWWRGSDTFTALVAICHIVLAASIGALSVAALIGVLTREPWNFGSPTLGILIAFWHLMYVRRRPRTLPP